MVIDDSFFVSRDKAPQKSQSSRKIKAFQRLFAQGSKLRPRLDIHAEHILLAANSCDFTEPDILDGRGKGPTDKQSLQIIDNIVHKAKKQGIHFTAIPGCLLSRPCCTSVVPQVKDCFTGSLVVS
jgi:hypothetical protein